MKKAFIIAAVVCTAITSNAQKATVWVSTSINSNLDHQLGKYPNKTGTGVFEAMFGNFLIGVISGGDVWGNAEANEDWVVKKNVAGHHQFNIGCDFPDRNDKKMTVGFTLTHADYKFVKTWESGRTTTTNEKFTGLMVRVQRSWYRNKWLDLSSGIGVGLAKQTVTGAVRKTRHPILGQVTPVKATITQDNVGIYIAPGLGSTGTEIGAVVKF